MTAYKMATLNLWDLVLPTGRIVMLLSCYDMCCILEPVYLGYCYYYIVMCNAAAVVLHWSI